MRIVKESVRGTLKERDRAKSISGARGTEDRASDLFEEISTDGNWVCQRPSLVATLD